MTQATIRSIVNAHEATEGAGFPIRRLFPTQELDMVDPFLMLDHMRESVARMGPFVMNTRSEIEQAVADFHAGHMGVL